jgi:hypothetical protein
MITTHNVKIVRLSSGEDVIADCISSKDSSHTILNNPMNLIFKRTVKGTVMLMVPWLPIEIICDNMATIDNTEILTTVDPKLDLVEYYGYMVDYTNTSAAANDTVLENIRAEMLELKDEQMANMDPETERQVEEVLNKVDSDRKRRLH